MAQAVTEAETSGRGVPVIPRFVGASAASADVRSLLTSIVEDLAAHGVAEGHSGPVRAVAFSPDGRHIVSGSGDRTLRLWEVESGAARTLEGHGGWVYAVAFSPDGRHIVSGSYDRTLRLWEVASGREIARLDGDFAFFGLSLAPDGKSLAAGDGGGRVHLIDILIDEPDKAAWLARQDG